MSEHKLLFPTVALRGITILPGNVAHFDVSRQISIRALDEAMQDDQIVLLVSQKDSQIDAPQEDDLYKVGTIARVKQVIRMPQGMVRVLVEGIKRASIISVNAGEKYITAVAAEIPRPNVSEYEDYMLEGMARSIGETFGEYAAVNRKIGKEFVSQIMEQSDPLRSMEMIMGSVPIPYQEKQRFLEAVSLEQQFAVVQDAIKKETAVLQVKDQLQRRVKQKIDDNQKEYILREEMKALQEELGDGSGEDDAENFRKAIEELDAPEHVIEKLQKELRRFKSVSANSSESAVIRSYLETMLELPWNRATEDKKDIAFAQQVLDEDHYGLEKVKERIIEFLAVRALTEQSDSQIICLAGPPGTGKTSIAKSIARALNKEYVRISLGGVRDEAEIRGHRRTYVGAMPGRIIYGLQQAKVNNPLMLLDEIDKTGADRRGDTASALLEVLDSEQNCNFRDHYVEMPVDLSKVFFICTANNVQEIPKPLLDRMEVIEVTSYTENEKFHIASEHLVQKQIEKNGLKPEQFAISDEAIEKLISAYTKEAGVRTLERKIGQLCRKAAKAILANEKTEVHVEVEDLKELLGKELYQFNAANEEPQVGIVRGLAWTSVGGDTLEIEVNIMPGKGDVKLTGQLGDVMKESAMAGLSCVRSVAEKYKVKSKFFEEHDIHIHIPEGAVPKDGPSAGVTMACAMLSAVTGSKIRPDVAMTGEITLRGRVLPVGGLKEKTLAAKRAGITTVCVPKKNEKDMAELSEEILEGLTIRYLEHLSDAVDIAFIK